VFTDGHGIKDHFIRGYGDRSRQAEVYLLPGAAEAALTALAGDQVAAEHLDRVSRLIERFETPYGVELLATVHWVAQEDPGATSNSSAVVASVRAWSDRKRQAFRPEHIDVGPLRCGLLAAGTVLDPHPNLARRGTDRIGG
jgi:hypothetical protein